jgi:MFS family permease
MDTERRILGVSRTVFVLGIVSFLTDVSSEMLVPVLPQFLRYGIGASASAIGFIEAIAEATASLLRVWAGYLADRIGRPKLLTTLGYGLSALSKPFLIPATSWIHVFAVRFADRFGKGIRSAPRDVMIADASDPKERGRAFGLHRAMDTAGATMGPLLVLLLVALLIPRGTIHSLAGAHRHIYTVIFIAAAVPAFLGWLVLLLLVPEKKLPDRKAERPRISLSMFDKRFKLFLLTVAIFAIGNSSDAFLVLRATSKDSIDMGFLAFMWVYVCFNALQAFVSYRSGVVSDRIGRKPLIVGGWLVFAVCYFAVARITTSTGVWIWYLIYGAYYGMTEGVLRAYAVDLAPPKLKGTAVGVYYTVNGLALLPASIVAGQLWDRISPSAPFYYGAAAALLAAILMMVLVRGTKPTREAS